MEPVWARSRRRATTHLLGLGLLVGVFAVLAACTAPVSGTWTAVPPLTVGATTGLATVSCPAPDRCLAIGPSSDGTRAGPVVQRWDGRSWTLGPQLPVPRDAEIEVATVACSSATHCVAVGLRLPAPDAGPYLAHFDGHTWTDESEAIRSLAPASLLTDVWCGGTTCITVGLAGPTGAAFIDTGSGWATMPAPPASPSYGFRVPGRGAVQIDCASPTSCASTTLIGLDSYYTGAAYWDGTAWRGSPDAGSTPGHSLLAGVACPAPGRCLVTGETWDPEGDGPTTGLIMEWTGSAWVSQHSPSALGSVSCAGVDRCVAVASPFGRLEGASALSGAMVRRQGSWHAVTGPTPPIERVSALEDISCTATMCMAVGRTPTAPLAYRWAF